MEEQSCEQKIPDDYVVLDVRGQRFILKRSSKLVQISDMLSTMLDENSPFHVKSAESPSEMVYTLDTDPSAFALIYAADIMGVLPYIADSGIKERLLACADYLGITNSILDFIYQSEVALMTKLDVEIQTLATMTMSGHHFCRENDGAGRIYCTDCRNRDIDSRWYSRSRRNRYWTLNTGKSKWNQSCEYCDSALRDPVCMKCDFDDYTTCRYCGKMIKCMQFNSNRPFFLGLCHKCSCCYDCVHYKPCRNDKPLSIRRPQNDPIRDAHTKIKHAFSQRIRK